MLMFSFLLQHAISTKNSKTNNNRFDPLLYTIEYCHRLVVFPFIPIFFYANTPVIVDAETEITNMLSNLREFFEQTTNPQAEERKNAVCPAVIVFVPHLKNMTIHSGTMGEYRIPSLPQHRGKHFLI